MLWLMVYMTLNCVGLAPVSYGSFTAMLVWRVFSFT